MIGTASASQPPQQCLTRICREAPAIDGEQLHEAAHIRVDVGFSNGRNMVFQLLLSASLYHYDLSTEFYRLFFDAGLNYLCAVFERPTTDTLEQAQHRKLKRATAKLRLLPGMTVAEIGSGWGAFAIHIAATTGARVTAISVSSEQIRVARENAVAAGVDGLVEFRELDYRALEGHFDRVVSVGMMGHGRSCRLHRRAARG